MEILKAEHVTKVYGTGENQVKALDDVSFSVHKGEFIAIIGPSGSRKSTLLHVLGGVDGSNHCDRQFPCMDPPHRKSRIGDLLRESVCRPFDDRIFFLWGT